MVPASPNGPVSEEEATGGQSRYSFLLRTWYVNGWLQGWMDTNQSGGNPIRMSSIREIERIWSKT